MNYWLVKSEPSVYSWNAFVKDGKTTWDGIRNYAARNHIRSMKKDDEILFYHSNEGMEIVGIAQVIKESYQDPTTNEEAWLAVDLKPLKALKNPVSLTEIKKVETLANMALLRISRLSVQPVTEVEYKIILKMSD
ncbi:MAG TPA: EVE domain-containing protein [Chitinophagaceae bacterium]|nr:EVE domain-containing protein [Chitinophagaceae bacterium]